MEWQFGVQYKMIWGPLWEYASRPKMGNLVNFPESRAQTAGDRSILVDPKKCCSVSWKNVCGVILFDTFDMKLPIHWATLHWALRWVAENSGCDERNLPSLTSHGDETAFLLCTQVLSQYYNKSWGIGSCIEHGWSLSTVKRLPWKTCKHTGTHTHSHQPVRLVYSHKLFNTCDITCSFSLLVFLKLLQVWLCGVQQPWGCSQRLRSTAEHGNRWSTGVPRLCFPWYVPPWHDFCALIWPSRVGWALKNNCLSKWSPPKRPQSDPSFVWPSSNWKPAF